MEILCMKRDEGDFSTQCEWGTAAKSQGHHRGEMLSGNARPSMNPSGSCMCSRSPRHGGN